MVIPLFSKEEYTDSKYNTLYKFLLTLYKEMETLDISFYFFQGCAERQCFENEIHFARLAAPLVIATWAWQSHICRRRSLLLLLSHYHFFSSSLRRVGYLLFVKFPESSENGGMRPLLFISFKFNLNFCLLGFVLRL